MSGATPKGLRLNRRALFASLGYEPHPGQRKVHDSKAPRRVLACGVRWGKTRCAAMEAVAASLEPRERTMGWVVAPTYDLADKVFREIQLIAAQHLRHRIVSMRESDRRIVLHNMAGGVSEVRAKSADNPVSLLGEGLDYVIVDEAARLKPSIWESHLSQRLIDKKGWALLISTPRGKGWFFELYRRGQSDDPHYASWNSPSRHNPHLDAALIEQERARLPERVFQQEYEGRFIEGSGAVFRNVRECTTGGWERPRDDRSYVAGLDLAKVEDYTCMIVLDNNRHVVWMDRFHRLDWSEQENRIVKLSRHFRQPHILCDATGVGDPIVERLRIAGCHADPLVLTAPVKTGLIDNLAMLLEQRQIVLPRADLWPALIDELEAYEYTTSEQGHVRSGAPYGQHDDTVIALALAAWRLRPHPTPRITRLVIRRRPRRYFPPPDVWRPIGWLGWKAQ